MFEPSVDSDYLTVEEEQGLPHGERDLLLGSPNRIHIDILVSPCSSFCGVIGSCSDGFISFSSEFALLPSSAELGASLQSVDELASCSRSKAVPANRIQRNDPSADRLRRTRRSMRGELCGGESRRSDALWFLPSYMEGKMRANAKACLQPTLTTSV